MRLLSPQDEAWHWKSPSGASPHDETTIPTPVPRFRLCQKRTYRAWGAAHLSSRPTLLLPKDAPPADFPFAPAGSPDATRGATPARTRMASATCPTRILECPCL
eukprot:COSAG01_NODE_29929_length_626_cov_7.531309_1_plen_103_part_01